MPIKTIHRKEASFADVFEWAEKEKLAFWNQCCDYFHGTEFFPYKRNREFYLSDLEYKDEKGQSDYSYAPEALNIMIKWMKAHNLKKIMITND